MADQQSSILEALLPLIPPALANVGGLIVSLLKENPFALPNPLRSLAATLVTSVIWCGYFLAQLVGRRFFYSEFLMLGLAITGTAALGHLLFSEARVHASEEASRGLGNTLRFGIGLLMLSMSLTIYAASRGQVIVLVPAGSAVWATYSGPSQPPVALRMRRVPEGSACALPKVEYERISELEINAPNGTRKLSGARLRQLESRGMGEVLGCEGLD